MTGRHMIVATQATREAGVRFGRVIARSTVSRWMANTPTATIAPTRSVDAPVITAPYPQRSTRRPYRSMRYPRANGLATTAPRQACDGNCTPVVAGTCTLARIKGRLVPYSAGRNIRPRRQR